MTTQPAGAQSPTPRTDGMLSYLATGVYPEHIPHSWVEPLVEHARTLERELSTADAALAEAQIDQVRYRKLKAAITVPMAMQSFIKHMGWHPDTFKMGIDEAIDAALSSTGEGSGG